MLDSVWGLDPLQWQETANGLQIVSSWGGSDVARQPRDREDGSDAG